MKPPSILPLGTPDRPQSPAPIEPIDSDRPGPAGNAVEIAVLIGLGLALIIRAVWPC